MNKEVGIAPWPDYPPERNNQIVEFSCPNCGHKTRCHWNGLMRRSYKGKDGGIFSAVQCWSCDAELYLAYHRGRGLFMSPELEEATTWEVPCLVMGYIP